ncbi:MAG: substrate-binding domain-containing protein [Streptosporangiales bacterium]|nr:substrate-binding domain-containing protein [Streptosporangiales bacterium]
MKSSRPIALLAAVLLAAACGGAGETGAGPGQEGERRQLTLITGLKSDEFYITMGCGAMAEAKKLGVDLDVQGPEDFSAPLQIPIVNSVTAQQPDAVLIAPTDRNALIQPMRQMKSAGITTVQVDTTIDDPSIAVSSIASNNEQGGQVAAQTLAELVGDKGKVYVINVKPGISTTDARAEGFINEMKKHPDIAFVGQDYDEDQADIATQKVSATLAKHPDLAGIFATNLIAAEGAATALKAAGKTGDVKLVGFDAGPKQVEDLRNGSLQAVVAQEPYAIGQIGVQQAVKALNGEPTRKQIQTNLVPITAKELESKSRYLYKSEC